MSNNNCSRVERKRSRRNAEQFLGVRNAVQLALERNIFYNPPINLFFSSIDEEEERDPI